MPTTKIEHKAKQKQKKKGTKRTKEQFDDTKMGHQNPYIDERQTMQ